MEKETTSLLGALRDSTKKLHMELHEHPILHACQMQRISKDGYISLLQAFYEPWKLIASSIPQVPIESLTPKLNKRVEAIQNDLLLLNVDLTLPSAANKRTYKVGELLGICYVMIGSSMGATMLSNCINSTLGDIPISYLSMTPKEAGWPELSSYLRTLNAEDYPTAATAALATFSLIQTQLSLSIRN